MKLRNVLYERFSFQKIILRVFLCKMYPTSPNFHPFWIAESEPIVVSLEFVVGAREPRHPLNFVKLSHVEGCNEKEVWAKVKMMRAGSIVMQPELCNLIQTVAFANLISVRHKIVIVRVTFWCELVEVCSLIKKVLTFYRHLFGSQTRIGHFDMRAKVQRTRIVQRSRKLKCVQINCISYESLLQYREQFVFYWTDRGVQIPKESEKTYA